MLPELIGVLSLEDKSAFTYRLKRRYNNAMQSNDIKFQINDSSLTGSSQKHLVVWSADAVDIGSSHNSSIPVSPYLIYPDVAAPLAELRQLAGEQGFDLRLCSSFRSFDRQLTIWNGKVNGQRPVYDNSGAKVDMQALNEWQQVQAIMRWSALPGASRHHWGTDFDIYDAAAIDENYQLQLSPQEVEGEGVFAPFHNWLDTVIGSEIGASGFYRPYAKDSGGVAPERWHISYRPVAEQFAARLTHQVIKERLLSAEIALKDTVLQNLDKIYPRYIHLPK
jgi:LAS superfamily LD-carboxypeptidase LdcB